MINPQLYWIRYNCMILQQAGLQFSQIFKTPKPTRNFILAHWLDVLEDTTAKAYNYLNHVEESIARLTTAYETQGIFTFLDTTKQVKTLRGYSQAVKYRRSKVGEIVVDTGHHTDIAAFDYIPATVQQTHTEPLPSILTPETILHLQLSRTQRKQLFLEAIELWESFASQLPNTHADVALIRMSGRVKEVQRATCGGAGATPQNELSLMGLKYTGPPQASYNVPFPSGHPHEGRMSEVAEASNQPFGGQFQQ